MQIFTDNLSRKKYLTKNLNKNKLKRLVGHYDRGLEFDPMPGVGNFFWSMSHILTVFDHLGDKKSSFEFSGNYSLFLHT
jgi:hypothetical protein